MGRRSSDPDRQLDLFADARNGPTSAALDEAPDPALVALRERVPPHVRLGTSSWTFTGWGGIVYKRPYKTSREFVRESLSEYARYPLFRTVGIDRGFYAPIGEDELRAYAAQLPTGFECVSKVWSEITTMIFPEREAARAGKPNPAFLDPDVFAEQIAAPYREAFADHTGPFVLEIPRPDKKPDRAAFEAAVERFLERAPAGLRYAFELRDRNLLTDRYLAILRAHGAAHVFNFWSQMPRIGQQLDRAGALWGTFSVARLMIPPGRRYAAQKERFEPFDRIVEPQPEMRADVVRLAHAAADAGGTLFVIVNNKAEGSSPLTVRALAEELAAGA